MKQAKLFKIDMKPRLSLIRHNSNHTKFFGTDTVNKRVIGYLYFVVDHF